MSGSAVPGADDSGFEIRLGYRRQRWRIETKAGVGDQQRPSAIEDALVQGERRYGSEPMQDNTR